MWINYLDLNAEQIQKISKAAKKSMAQIVNINSNMCFLTVKMKPLIILENLFILSLNNQPWIINWMRMKYEHEENSAYKKSRN